MNIKVDNFNLKDTVTCGQIFRFNEEEDLSYTVVLSDRVVNLKLEDDTLIVDSNNMENIEKVIKDYFDLDFDYDTLNTKLIEIDSDNKIIIDACKGLKMINEPKVEVIISYILSSNNRVPQIRKALDNISERYGEKVIFRDKEYYLFPTVEKLKKVSIEEYRDCKAGFRDKYIYEMINKIDSGDFDINIIDNMDSIEAMEYLMKNNGIGEKVASCILLFGYHRFDVFPIDTWVKKYMKEKYNLEKVPEIRNFMKEKYDKNSGLIIQYIFNYSRNKK